MSALPLSIGVGELARRTHTTPKPAIRLLKRFHLAGDMGYGFELVQPLPVDIERDENGAFLASDPLFGVYGHGATEDDAVSDFTVSLVEFYEIMSEGVNPETQAVIRHLQTYLQRLG